MELLKTLMRFMVFFYVENLLQSAKLEPVHVSIILTFSGRFSQNIPRCSVYKSAWGMVEFDE